MICNKSLVFYQPHAHMKKTLLPILTLVVYLIGSISVTAEEHKHKLHEIGERIKQAVKAGKITEKEGWAKWKAVQEEYHDHEVMDESNNRIVELELEMKARELEMEIERMEKEHELEIRAMDFQLQRMESEFDRERRDWEMERMHWDRERHEMERRMQSHDPHHRDRPPHQAGPGEGPRRGPPMSVRPPHGRPGQDHGSKPERSSSKKKGK